MQHIYYELGDKKYYLSIKCNRDKNYIKQAYKNSYGYYLDILFLFVNVHYYH